MIKSVAGRSRIVLAVGLLALAQYSNATLVDGLVNYWDFDDNLVDKADSIAGSASTVADNGTFDGVNGTAGVGYTASGLFGSALEQNGAAGANQNDGFVRVNRSADTLAGGESVTISLWVDPAGFDTSWQTILAHGEGNQYRIARRGNENIASYAGGSGEGPTGGPDLLLDAWHHILAITENGVSTRLWVDGGLVTTGAAPLIIDDGNSNPTLPDLLIGANPQTGAQNREWLGLIDDVGMWDRVLSEDEIAAVYRGGLAGSSLGALTMAVVPSPSTFALMLWGLMLVSLARVRKQKNQAS